jgi:hypothetical protein
LSDPATSTPRTFNPGSAYNPERGLLYLFDRQGVLVVRAWPDPRAWRLGLVGPWKGARPIGLDLGAPDRQPRGRARARRRHRCQAQAFAAIPEPQRRLAARFGDRAWPLHCLLTRVPGAAQLADQCPALATGLAFHAALRPAVTHPFRSARALLAKPPPRISRAVAAWLGFPSGRAAVRVLRRLPADLCSPANLHLLQRALTDPAIARLLHHAVGLNRAVMVLLRHLLDPESPVVAAAPLLQRLGELPAAGIPRALGPLGYAVHCWREAWPDRPMPTLLSVRQLEHLAQRAQAELNSPERIRAAALALGPFAAPPIAPDNVLGLQLDPLATVDHVLREARIMGHCIASHQYIEDSVRGVGFGYAVSSTPALPGADAERATAWVVPTGGGCYELAQIRGPHNTPPSEHLAAALRVWIHQHNHPHLAPRRRGDALDQQRAKGHTLRVVRHRPARAAPRPAAQAPPPRRRAPPPQGHQLDLYFFDDMPF